MSRETTVLYDPPGPRTRRATLIASLVAGVLVISGAYLFVYRPLANNGQFTLKKWGPLVNPNDETFPLVWNRLAEGFTATLIAAACAIVASLCLGTALAVLRLQLKALMRRRFAGQLSFVAYGLRAAIWVLNAVTRFCVEIFRGIPVVTTIFFVWVALPQLGIKFDDVLWYLVIGLCIYNSIVIGEILRSGMQGLPGGQREAAESIGLSSFQTTRMILLPQAFRIMLPALISQLVVVLKDTSLGFIITYEDVLAVANQIIQVLGNPIQMYFVVGTIFITVNYSLSKLAEYIQRRLARGRAMVAPTTGAAGTTLETEAVVGTTT